MITEKERDTLTKRYETHMESQEVARQDSEKYQSYANRLARKYSGMKKGSLIELKDNFIKDGKFTRIVSHVAGELIGSDLRISIWHDTGFTFNDLLLVYFLSEGLPEYVSVIEK
jgi:hypothetical protein